MDALLRGLDGEQQLVFLNQSRPLRRQRFSLAHELGHLLTPWHQAHELMCEAENDDFADEDLSHRVPGRDAKSLTIRCQELEANAFAARILVPRRFVEAIAELDGAEILEELEKADVSVPAGLRALAECLPPGFVFVELNDEGNVVRHWESGKYGSSLVVVPGIGKGRPIDFDLALASLDEYGYALHYDRRFWWGKTATDIAVPPGSTNWRETLTGILGRTTMSEDESATLWKSICGVGGFLQNNVGLVPVGELAGLYSMRLRRNPCLVGIVLDPEFPEFVRRWARERNLAARKKRAKELTLR